MFKHVWGVVPHACFLIMKLKTMRNKRAKAIRKIAAVKSDEARKAKTPFHFRRYYRKLKKYWTQMSINQKTFKS